MNKDFDSLKAATLEKFNSSSQDIVKFLTDCSKKELLAYQSAFYFAVEAFPRMLCLLGSKIETSDSRLSIIDNLFEEHGRGDGRGFHVNTYKAFLASLNDGVPVAIDSVVKIDTISNWISYVLIGKMSGSQLSAYLAGVEYIYAPISAEIVKKLKVLGIESEQTHYAIHSELDWMHGFELVEVAEAEGISSEDFDKFFKEGQEALLNIFNKLIFPLKSEYEKIAKNTLSFGITREDFLVEQQAVIKLSGLKEKLNVLSVCSGGENLFAMLAVASVPTYIKAFDLNLEQLKAAQIKEKFIKECEFSKELDIEPLKPIGKFENIFALLRQYAVENSKDITDLAYHIDKIFSNENLEIVFTSSATKNSIGSFSNHFFEAISISADNGHENAKNILFDKVATSNVPSFKNGLLNQNNSIEYVKASLFDVITAAKANSEIFDLVDISNISDWIEPQDFDKILDMLKDVVSANGLIIARRLLGNYSLKQKLSNLGFKVYTADDQTKFYSETIVAENKKD